MKKILYTLLANAFVVCTNAMELPDFPEIGEPPAFTPSAAPDLSSIKTHPFTLQQDMNQDGWGDLIVKADNGFYYSLNLAGDGGNEWGGWDWINTPSEFDVLSTVYRDGKINLLVRSNTPGEEYSWIVRLQGDNNTQWLDYHWINIPTNFTIKAASDFNGDGKFDIVIEDENQWKYIVYLTGDNNNEWLDWHWINLEQKFDVKGVGHFNDDFKIDLVVEDRDEGWKYFVYLTGDNNNIWNGFNWINAPADFELKLIGDYNTDGSMDLVIESTEGWKYIVYLTGDNNTDWLDWAWVNAEQSMQVVGPTPEAMPAPPATSL